MSRLDRITELLSSLAAIHTQPFQYDTRMRNLAEAVEEIGKYLVEEARAREEQD
jgi:hypothetical protein